LKRRRSGLGELVVAAEGASLQQRLLSVILAQAAQSSEQDAGVCCSTFKTMCSAQQCMHVALSIWMIPAIQHAAAAAAAAAHVLAPAAGLASTMPAAAA
jgi:hypothetical protein